MKANQRASFNMQISHETFVRIVKSWVSCNSTAQDGGETSSENVGSPFASRPGPVAARGRRGARSVAVRGARGAGRLRGRGGGGRATERFM